LIIIPFLFSKRYILNQKALLRVIKDKAEGVFSREAIRYMDSIRERQDKYL
jgi:hypothetical protein